MKHQFCQHDSQYDNFESPCWRRTIKCPLMVHNCDERLELGEVQSHCEKNHPQLVFHNQFSHHGMQFGSAAIVLLIMKQIPYMIYFWLFEDDMRIAAFCLNPCTGLISAMDVCNIKLCANDELVLNNNYNIIDFDNFRHCPRCTFGSSRNSCHPESSQRSRIDRLWQIHNNAVTELLRSRTFDCHIQLLSSNSLPAADINNNSAFLEILTCGICRNVMQSEIFICTNGHCICKNCRRRMSAENVSQCYFCKGDMGKTRNYLLEEIAQKYSLVKCKNNGCSLVDNLAYFEAHENYCPFKTESRD